MKKYRQGPFTYTEIELGDGAEALGKMLQATSPPGRIAEWRMHAERLGVGTDCLDEAEALFDAKGHLPRELEDRFDLLMERAVRVIETAQNEQALVPKARMGISHSKVQSRKGQKRWSEDEKNNVQKRNDEIVEAYHKKSARTSKHNFATTQAEKYGISVTRIKDILKENLH